MCPCDHDELHSDRVTRLDIVRAWRDMVRFEDLSPAEQWQDIGQSWPPPFAEGLDSHPEIRLIHNELAKATTTIQTMMAAWDALKAEVDRRAAGSAPDAGNWPFGLAESMLNISALTQEVAECQKRISQINGRSAQIRRVVEAETRQRYRLAHDNIRKKMAIALTGYSDSGVSEADFAADVLLLRLKLLVLKLEATGADITGREMPADPLFGGILFDYLQGSRDTRSQILYLLRTRMSADPEVFRHLEVAVAAYETDTNSTLGDEV